ncbi:MAG: alanine racemase [bacterium]
MNKNLRKGLRTWIKIDKKAIAYNYHIFHGLISPKCKIFSVVKSNAYGHNLVEFAQEQEKLGADFLGVDSVVEAITLRKEGIKIPILVLGYTLPEMIKDASRRNISITVSNFESFSAVIKTDKKVKIHIKVDTGMNRHGFLEKDISKVLKILKNNNPSQIKSRFDGAGNIVVEGLYTHFSMAKDPNSRTYTNSQIEKFNKWHDAFLKVGYRPICHTSATSGALLYKKAQYNMIRVGIGLYGIWPSKEAKKYFDKKIKLEPVLSWKTIVVEIKKIPKGSKVGYDGTCVVKRNSMIAVLPIGYWHGYPRALSNIGHVLINGEKAKILGRICMDIIMVDITDIKNVKVGDEVVIIGKSKNNEITADEISKLLDGSTYELLTRINPLIKRFYI